MDRFTVYLIRAWNWLYTFFFLKSSLLINFFDSNVFGRWMRFILIRTHFVSIKFISRSFWLSFVIWSLKWAELPFVLALVDWGEVASLWKCQTFIVVAMLDEVLKWCKLWIFLEVDIFLVIVVISLNGVNSMRGDFIGEVSNFFKHHIKCLLQWS